MSRGERAFNWMLGLSICSWAILGWLAELPRPWLVQLVVSALHISVGFLVLTRRPVVRHGSWSACLASVPSLIAAGLALRWAPQTWAYPLQLAFAIAGLWTIASLMFLGRSFAILPAVRTTISRGTYSLVRHPAYLGEVLMLGSCVIAAGTWTSLGLFIVAVITVVWRIIVEERVLNSARDYVAYKERIRWRLLPWVW